jgi:hypothetical protein
MSGLKRFFLILAVSCAAFRAEALDYPLAIGTQLIFDVTTTAVGQFPMRWRNELWILDERKSGGFDAIWVTFTGIGTPNETIAGALPFIVQKNGAKEFPMEREATYSLQEQVESFLPTLPDAFDQVWKGPVSVSGWYCSYQPIEVLPDKVRCSFAQYGQNKMDEIVKTETLGEIFFDTRYNWPVELSFTTRQAAGQGQMVVSQANVKLAQVIPRDQAWAAGRKEEAKVFFQALRRHDEELMKANDNLSAATLELAPAFEMWERFLAENTTSRFYRLAQNQFRVLQSSIPALQSLWLQRKRIIGSPAPPWTLSDTDGGSYSLQSIPNPVLLLFWSRTNWWSLVAIQQIQTLMDKYAPQGLIVLPINVDATDQEAKDALSIMGARVTTLRTTDPNLVTSYGIPLGAYPSTVLVGSDKKIVDIRYGWGNQVRLEIEERIDSLF